MSSLIDRIFGQTIGGLTQELNLSWKRNQVIASNVANAETPRYRAMDLNFAGALDRAYGQQKDVIKKTAPNHIDLQNNSGTEKVEQDVSGVTKPDGNNVDIDLQMGKLAYNAGRFSTAANLIRKQLGLYRAAIRDASR